jgi:cytochrome P450
MNAFTSQVVTAMRMSIEQRVDRPLERMERTRTCDFVSEFAYPVPSLVIFEILGIPAEHHDTIRESAERQQLFRGPYTSSTSKRWNRSRND